MRKVHDAIDALINTHVEMARVNQTPEVVEMLDNLRKDVHLLVDDAIKAARGQESDLQV